MVSLSAIPRIALVARSRFLTITVQSAYRFAGRDMGIKALPVELPVKARPVTIVTLKNRLLTPAAQLFIDQARKIAKDLQHTRN